MTPRIRIVTYIAAGTLVVATTVGCGFLNAAKKIAANVGTISDFSNKMQAGLTATYKATYTDTDGTTVTVQQAPPKSVYISSTGPLIFDGTTSYSCDNSSGSMVCAKTVYQGSSGVDSILGASVFASGGFMAGALGVDLILAAAFVPTAKTTYTTKTIAGQSSDCVSISGLPSDTASTDPSAFTMCITANGIVSEYSATDSDGKQSGSTMTAYSATIDPSLFLPPAGAQIVDTSSPFPSAPPSVTVPSPAPSQASTPPSAAPSASPTS